MASSKGYVVLSLCLAILFVAVSAAADAAPFFQETRWKPQVSIVWPHDGQGEPVPVAKSQAVNVSVWPRNEVYCTESPPGLVLWLAQDNEPATPVEIEPELSLRRVGETTFPSLEYNAIPSDVRRSPLSRYYFFVGFAGNVWVHASDARTYLPNAVIPTGTAEGTPSQVDTRIQIVWPHDGQGRFASVADATAVNVAVDIFAHGTLLSVPRDYSAPFGERTVTLYVAEGNLPMEWVRNDLLIARGEKTFYTENGEAFPRWVFNNVPVNPDGQYHFLVRVSGDVVTFPSVWTHAQNPLTLFATPEPPPSSGPDCS